MELNSYQQARTAESNLWKYHEQLDLKAFVLTLNIINEAILAFAHRKVRRAQPKIQDRAKGRKMRKNRTGSRKG